MAKKLYFYYGTMSSSKTLNLLATAYNADENNFEILCLKPSVDTREGSDSVIRSRAGIERNCIMIDSDEDVYLPIKEYKDHLEASGKKLDWVYVDECQFLTPLQVDQLADVVDKLDVDVSCYGLRTDFTSHLFPGSKRLLEIADTITEFKIRCKCGRKAIINARIDDSGNVLSSGEQVVIGGNDRYTPMCRKCWKEKINK